MIFEWFAPWKKSDGDGGSKVLILKITKLFFQIESFLTKKKLWLTKNKCLFDKCDYYSHGDFQFRCWFFDPCHNLSTAWSWENHEVSFTQLFLGISLAGYCCQQVIWPAPATRYFHLVSPSQSEFWSSKDPRITKEFSVLVPNQADTERTEKIRKTVIRHHNKRSKWRRR